jgi:hypothetical protein
MVVSLAGAMIHWPFFLVIFSDFFTDETWLKKRRSNRPSQPMLTRSSSFSLFVTVGAKMFCAHHPAD